jgi:hypothetical protein
MPKSVRKLKGMTVLSDALKNKKLLGESVAWSWLKSDNAPAALAILDYHLGGKMRQIEVEELFELLENNLDELRDYGFDMPRSAQSYCADWRKAGILIRRPDAKTRSETFELSAGALFAIQFVKDLLSPRQTVTQSRLTTIIERLESLVNDTDPNIEKRKEYLLARKKKIEDELEKLKGGDVDLLEDRSALERAEDIISLAKTIPADFAHVRMRFEEINQDLRVDILNEQGDNSDILTNVFRGIDLLEESSEGKSFSAFYSLLLDPESSASFESDINQALSRPFAEHLTDEQHKFLRGLFTAMRDQSYEINDTLTSFARSLRRFVQSKEYQKERKIKELLESALKKAQEASDKIKLYDKIGFHAQLSSAQIRGVGAINLHNPGDSKVLQEITMHTEEVLDLGKLIETTRQTDIDFVELTKNINLSVGEYGRCSVGDVLERYPATQGIASVIGLLLLAGKHGIRDDTNLKEMISWNSKSGVLRHSKIAKYVFIGAID